MTSTETPDVDMGECRIRRSVVALAEPGCAGAEEDAMPRHADAVLGAAAIAAVETDYLQTPPVPVDHPHGSQRT